MDIGDPVLGTAKTTVTTVVKPLDLVLIRRDDLYVCLGNVDILALNPRLMIYSGKITDSWDKRKKFVEGAAAFQAGLLPVLQPGQIDVTRLTREELIEFALDHYGLTLDVDTEYAHALVAVVQARQKAEEQEKSQAKQPTPARGRQPPPKRAGAGGIAV